MTMSLPGNKKAVFDIMRKYEIMNYTDMSFPDAISESRLFQIVAFTAVEDLEAVYKDLCGINIKTVISLDFFYFSGIYFESGDDFRGLVFSLQGEYKDRIIDEADISLDTKFIASLVETGIKNNIRNLAGFDYDTGALFIITMGNCIMAALNLSIDDFHYYRSKNSLKQHIKYSPLLQDKGGSTQHSPYSSMTCFLNRSILSEKLSQSLEMVFCV